MKKRGVSEKQKERKKNKECGKEEKGNEKKSTYIR
jgi:hypothetical protein